MNNFITLVLCVVAGVAVPIAVIVGIWADILPDGLAPIVSMAGVILAAAYIIGGNLLCMYGDIKTGRYSK